MASPAIQPAAVVTSEMFTQVEMVPEPTGEGRAPSKLHRWWAAPLAVVGLAAAAAPLALAFIPMFAMGLNANLGQAKSGTLEASRAALSAWWKKNLPGAVPPMIDNGSGLSRSERITATSLQALLQHAAKSPSGAALADSLPVAGMDATMRERAKGVAGQAFVKTGSLRDVTAIAGYANGLGGTRYIVVGMVNHPNASAARPALDALIDWAVKEDAR